MKTILLNKTEQLGGCLLWNHPLEKDLPRSSSNQHIVLTRSSFDHSHNAKSWKALTLRVRKLFVSKSHFWECSFMIVKRAQVRSFVNFWIFSRMQGVKFFSCSPHSLFKGLRTSDTWYVFCCNEEFNLQ